MFSHLELSLPRPRQVSRRLRRSAWHRPVEHVTCVGLRSRHHKRCAGSTLRRRLREVLAREGTYDNDRSKHGYACDGDVEVMDVYVAIVLRVHVWRGSDS